MIFLALCCFSTTDAVSAIAIATPTVVYTATATAIYTATDTATDITATGTATAATTATDNHIGRARRPRTTTLPFLLAIILSRRRGVKNEITAVGDTRCGQGTVGSMPPEAMKSQRPLCSPDQDVFGVGSLLLLAAFKPHLKRLNIFTSPVRDVTVWREV